MLRDPVLDQRRQLFGSGDNFVRVGARGHVCPGVVDLVALAAADLEIRGDRRACGAEALGQCLEGRHVMAPGARIEPVSGAGQRHLRQQQGGAISRRESRIVRDDGCSCVLQLDLGPLAQLVDFGFARLVSF